MAERPKILLVDDERDVLEVYGEILKQLPSQPEVRLCNSGSRAIALLESEEFDVLITDLKMPKMDGLQVLSIVRRKFPDLRIVVLTAIADEQYRSRVYALGVDLFWEKPDTQGGIKLFQECIESLIEHENREGFRGVQNKSLMDLIQLECLSHSTSVLKIINAGREGKIWVQEGDIIDAVAGDLAGEAAFNEIFGWRTGHFEILPGEPDRPRKIMHSSQALLLESAHVLDEARTPAVEEGSTAERRPSGPAHIASEFPRVEFALWSPNEKEKGQTQSWALDNVDPVAEWTRSTLRALRRIGETLHAGELQQAEAVGVDRHLALGSCVNGDMCVGMSRTMSPGDVKETFSLILQKCRS
jgi:CheY-like chemotaxis protein